MGEMRNAYKISVGKSEKRRPLGRPRSRWEGNIRMELREIWGNIVSTVHESRPGIAQLYSVGIGAGW
jgi:hypothetical protein